MMALKARTSQFNMCLLPRLLSLLDPSTCISVTRGSQGCANWEIWEMRWELCFHKSPLSASVHPSLSVIQHYALVSLQYSCLSIKLTLKVISSAWNSQRLWDSVCKRMHLGFVNLARFVSVRVCIIIVEQNLRQSRQKPLTLYCVIFNTSE